MEPEDVDPRIFRTRHTLIHGIDDTALGHAKQAAFGVRRGSHPPYAKRPTKWRGVA